MSVKAKIGQPLPCRKCHSGSTHYFNGCLEVATLCGHGQPMFWGEVAHCQGTTFHSVDARSTSHSCKPSQRENSTSELTAFTVEYQVSIKKWATAYSQLNVRAHHWRRDHSRFIIATSFWDWKRIGTCVPRPTSLEKKSN